jgi:molybdopterin molybdotransferase
MGDWHTTRADWLTIEEALERILAAVRPLEIETVPLPHALGRVLAEPAVSPIDQPPWDNSAMDGFAVRAADLHGATRDSPVVLTVVDAVSAGAFPARALGPYEAIKIMTGAPVPEGADTVVRVEQTDAWIGMGRATKVAASTQMAPAASARPESAADSTIHQVGPGTGAPGTRIRIFSDTDARRNIRRRGEDFRVGQTVVEAGRLLRPAEIGALAATGHAHVPVRRKPRIAILANGDELVDLDRFDEVAAGRRIVNSNSYALAAALTATGAEPVPLGIAADDPDSLREHLRAAFGADALITTAGASVGEHDLIKDILAELGFELDFWRVRMRPGSPFSFGRLNGIPVFGVAGNPVSALVTYEVLVRPAIRRMLGRVDVYPPVVRVRAGERIPGARGLVHLPRARLAADVDGRLVARLTGPQGSGILSSVADADALLVVPEGIDAIDTGRELVAIPLRPGDEASSDLGFSVTAT